MTDREQLFSVAEVAAELEMAPADVRRAVDDGLVRPRKVGTALVFTQADIDELSEALEDEDVGEDEDE